MWLHELGYTDVVAFYIFCALSGLVIILCLVLLSLRCCFTDYRPGNSMDFYVCFGSLVLSSTVLIRGLDTRWTGPEQVNTLCQLFPSLVIVGLSYFLGGLLMKIAAVLHYFKDNETRTEQSQEWKPNLWMLAVLFVDLAVVLVWLLVFPLESHPIDSDSVLSNTSTIGVLYECRGPQQQYWEGAVLIFHAVLIALSAVLVWPALYFSRGDRCASEVVFSIVTANVLVLCCVAGVLVHVLGPPNISHTHVYAGSGAVIFFALLSTLLLSILGKTCRCAGAEKKARRASGDYSHIQFDTVNSKHSVATAGSSSDHGEVFNNPAFTAHDGNFRY